MSFAAILPSWFFICRVELDFLGVFLHFAYKFVDLLRFLGAAGGQEVPFARRNNQTEVIVFVRWGTFEGKSTEGQIYDLFDSFAGLFPDCEDDFLVGSHWNFEVTVLPGGKNWSFSLKIAAEEEPAFFGMGLAGVRGGLCGILLFLLIICHL